MQRRDCLQSLAWVATSWLTHSEGAQSAPPGWPQFRGTPRQLGQAPGKLASKLTLVWKFKTGDAIASSPVIAEGRVFVGSNDRHLYALTLNDGREVWRQKAGDTVEAPPCVVGDCVAVGASDGQLYAFEAATGKSRWKYKTDDKIMGGANPFVPGAGATWLIVGSYDNFLHCINIADGKEVWKFETGNYVNGAPAISADGKVIFGGCDGVLYVVSARDGKKLRGLDVKSYIAGSAAFEGTRAYLGHYGNEFICADVAASRIVWTYRDKAYPFFSSPAVTADRVVVGSRDKRVHCVRKRDGKPLWTFRTRGKVDSSPVVCDGKVVVGSEDGRLYLLSLVSGKQLWSCEIGAPVMTSPAVVNGTTVVGADDGYVYAFTASK